MSARSLIGMAVLAAVVGMGCRRDGGGEATLRDWRMRHLSLPGEAGHGGARSAAGSPGDGGASAAMPPRVEAENGGGARRAAQASRHGVLTMNDETITVADILDPLRDELAAAAATRPPDEYYAELHRTVRGQIMTEVAERLVMREATAALDEEKNKQIDAAVERVERDRIRDEYGGVAVRYEAALADQGLTRERVRARLRRRLVVQQYLRELLLPRIAVTRRELWEYYRDHPQEFSTPRRVEMGLIDIPLKSMLSDSEMLDAERVVVARRVARERLAEARRRILEGESFEEAARKYSKGLHAQQGGRWGSLISTPLAGYWEAPSRTALTLKAGQVSNVLDAPLGVYLVTAVRAEEGVQTTFEAAQPAILERVRQQRLQAVQAEYLQRLYERATLGDVDAFMEAVLAEAPRSQRLLGDNPTPAATPATAGRR